MKQSVQKILLMILALQILLGSVGMAFYEHTCFMSMKTRVSLRSEKACCDFKKEKAEKGGIGTQLKQASCCHTDVHYQKLDTQPGFDSRVVLQAPLILDLVPAFDLSFFKTGGTLVALSGFHPQIKAPPLGGRHLLARICMLRI